MIDREELAMLETDYEIMAPVPWLPAGLISWYAPNGLCMALVSSWVALLGGEAPRLRTAWHGRQDPLSRFWTGGDFVFNVPSERGLDALRDLMQRGRFCLYAEQDLHQVCVCATAVKAPLLTDCALQLECRGGLLVDSCYDTELTGEVVCLHRAQAVVDVAEFADLSAIQPLSPSPR